MGYIPPFKANLCKFAIHTTFLSGLRTTFIDTGHKDSSFFENNKTFSKKVNDLCLKIHFGITKYAVVVVVTTFCFAVMLLQYCTLGSCMFTAARPKGRLLPAGRKKCPDLLRLLYELSHVNGEQQRLHIPFQVFCV